MPSSRLAPPRHFCLAASRHPTPHHTLGFTPFTSTSRKTTKNTPLAWSHGLDSIGTGDHIRKVRKGPAVFFVVARFLRPSRLDRVKRTRPSSSRAVAPRRALFTSVTAVLDSPVHWLSYSRGDGVLEHRFIPFGPLTQSTPRPELQAGLSGRKVVTYRFVPHPPPVPSSSHPPPSQALTLRLGSASLPYARPALCPHSQETRPLIFFFSFWRYWSSSDLPFRPSSALSRAPSPPSPFLQLNQTRIILQPGPCGRSTTPLRHKKCRPLYFCPLWRHVNALSVALFSPNPSSTLWTPPPPIKPSLEGNISTLIPYLRLHPTTPFPHSLLLTTLY